MGKRNWIPVLILLALAIGFCWPVLLGRVMLPADTLFSMLPWRGLGPSLGVDRPHNPMLDPIQQYYPWRKFAVESVREGLIPLWNPYSFSGTPFLANLQSALLYPPNLLFLVAGPAQGFGWSAILHLFLGGTFMYLFLARLGLRRPAALLGGVVFAFNGFTVGWLEYPTVGLWVAMWLPLILYLYERAVSSRRWIWAAAAGAAVGTQLLGGHLQISAYVLLGFLAYALVRLGWRREGESGRRLQAAMAAGALALGFLLAMGQLLPTLELAARSHRPAGTFHDAIRTALPGWHLVKYLVPNFFGNPAAYNYWGDLENHNANFFETGLYVGVLPLLLAAVGLDWRRREVRFFAILGGFALLAALGTPLYGPLFYLAPGFKQLAGVARLLYLAAFCLAGLAGVGADRLLRGEQVRPVRAAILAAAGLVLVLASLANFLPTVTRLTVVGQARQIEGLVGLWDYLMIQLALFGLWLALGLYLILRGRGKGRDLLAGAMLVVVIADLFIFGIAFNPAVPPQAVYPETPAIRYLQERIGHQRMVSLAPSDRFLDRMPPNAPLAYRLRDVQGSDSLFWGEYSRFLQRISDRPGLLGPDYRQLDLLGVNWILTGITIADPEWELAYDQEVKLYRRVSPTSRAARRREKQQPVFLVDSPDRVVLEAAGALPGPLTLADPAYPGWRLWVDGRPQPHFAVGLFRTVRLAGGLHRLEWRFEPASFRVGLFLSLLGISVLAAAAAGRRP